MRGGFEALCARAVGDSALMPPMAARTSRRLTRSPRRRSSEVHRYRNAKVMCSLLIYDELELIWRLNRKLTRRSAPQYAIDVRCGLPILLAQVHAIRQQAADSCKLAERIDGRYPSRVENSNYELTVGH